MDSLFQTEQPALPHALRLGTSGWDYPDWKGNFYPATLPQNKRLGFYGGLLSTVEIDSTFYAMRPRAQFEKWAAQAPAGFLFSLKAPQRITHEKSLLDCDADVGDMLESIAGLGNKLGPVLFQFPYGFKPDRLPDLLTFLDRLPTADFKFVIEVRNRAWVKSNLVSELRDRKLTLALVDHPWMPRMTDLTGELVYIRWLGDQNAVTQFAGTQLDKRESLQWWAQEIVNWTRRDFPVFGYFNNHFAGHAPSDINLLRDLIGTILSHPS